MVASLCAMGTLHTCTLTTVEVNVMDRKLLALAALLLAVRYSRIRQAELEILYRARRHVTAVVSTACVGSLGVSLQRRAPSTG